MRERIVAALLIVLALSLVAFNYQQRPNTVANITMNIVNMGFTAFSPENITKLLIHSRTYVSETEYWPMTISFNYNFKYIWPGSLTSMLMPEGYYASKLDYQTETGLKSYPGAYYPLTVVQDWIHAHFYPDEHAYTLIFANLTDLGIPHYFSSTRLDVDTGSTHPRQFNMAATYGRTYLMDLTAGPFTYLDRFMFPMLHPTSDLFASYINTFISDVIGGTFIYSPVPGYAPKILIHAYNNVTDEVGPLEKYISAGVIANSLRELTGYDVFVCIMDEQYHGSEMERAVQYATVPVDGPIDRYEVDLDRLLVLPPVLKVISDWADLNPAWINVYLFAFKDAHFARGGQGLQGESLGPRLVLISADDENLLGITKLPYPEFQGHRYGYTDTIIHEVGHSLGMQHPFAMGDPSMFFLDSVMNYYPYQWRFSQFEIDEYGRFQAVEAIGMLQARLTFGWLNPHAGQALRDLKLAQHSFDIWRWVDATNYASAGIKVMGGAFTS